MISAAEEVTVTGGLLFHVWLEENPKDVRCLAISLWFEGGISMEEITGLKVADLLDGNGLYSPDPIVVKKNDSEDYLILTPARGKIIRAALALYPGEDQEYIFMDMEKDGLVKLAKTSLQPKLAYICRESGVVYKTCMLKKVDGSCCYPLFYSFLISESTLLSVDGYLRAVFANMSDQRLHPGVFFFSKFRYYNTRNTLIYEFF